MKMSVILLLSVLTTIAVFAQTTAKRAPRSRIAGIRQHQLELLDDTDASGLPVWRRDEGLDLTGLPVWAASC